MSNTVETFVMKTQPTQVHSLRAAVIGTGFIGPVHIEALRRLGFKLVRQDASNRMFVTLLLRKTGGGGGGGADINWPALRACVYKKR